MSNSKVSNMKDSKRSSLSKSEKVHPREHMEDEEQLNSKKFKHSASKQEMLERSSLQTVVESAHTKLNSGSNPASIKKSGPSTPNAPTNKTPSHKSGKSVKEHIKTPFSKGMIEENEAESVEQELNADAVKPEENAEKEHIPESFPESILHEAKKDIEIINSSKKIPIVSLSRPNSKKSKANSSEEALESQDEKLTVGKIQEEAPENNETKPTEIIDITSIGANVEPPSEKENPIEPTNDEETVEETYEKDQERGRSKNKTNKAETSLSRSTSKVRAGTSKSALKSTSKSATKKTAKKAHFKDEDNKNISKNKASSKKPTLNTEEFVN